ncbi:hypothetical protein KI387_002237, partial [Taxus chinensis]
MQEGKELLRMKEGAHVIHSVNRNRTLLKVTVKTEEKKLVSCMIKEITSHRRNLISRAMTMERINRSFNMGRKIELMDNEFRDHRTTERRERDDRTYLRIATIRSMNENDIFSSDVSCAAPRNFGVKRKVADAVNSHKLDFYVDPIFIQ